MELLVQTLVVAVLVLTSTIFAAWRLAPARTKLRLLNAVNPSTTNAVGRWLTRLRKGVTNELVHGCNACSQSDSAKKHAAPTRR